MESKTSVYRSKKILILTPFCILRTGLTNRNARGVGTESLLKTFYLGPETKRLQVLRLMNPGVLIYFFWTSFFKAKKGTFKLSNFNLIFSQP